tara:strand:+ start:573 stop:1448 length:876 start_codon:yes stop_codon:yes gene_type:complete
VGENELRYGSLFSGIGGIDLGMDMAGFECAWQVEIDDYCRQILDKHWPGVPKYKDIYEVKGAEIDPVDILCGGFPCQPVSVAGKRGGVNDERWLWDEFYRLICEIRPRWVVAENVTGLFSANSGRAFAGVLRDLAEGGYNAVWDVYPAGGPGGVGAPHRRERVFLVAHTDSPQSIKDTRDVREEFKVSKVNREDLSAVVSGGSGKDVADTNTKRLQGMVKESQTGARQIQQVGFCSRTSRWKGWDVEPNVGRVANGVPNRVDRLKTLGNAVVPQVAYKVARMIYEYTEKEK